MSTTGTRTTRVVRRDTVSIEVHAEGQGPLVVLLPSLGRDPLDYGEAASALAADGWRVLRPMPRGTGASRGPMDGLTLRELAEDVAAVIDHEAGGPAIVLGHAYGNFVARMLAVVAPTLVRGVVLAAAAARSFPQALSADIDLCEDPSQPEPARLAALQRCFFAPGHDPRPWLDGWHAAAKRMQRAARSATPLEDFWHAGSAPVLDLVAAEDPFRPADSHDENRALLGADRVTVRVIAGASHALLPEQPRAVAAAITDWAARLPTERPLWSNQR